MSRITKAEKAAKILVEKMWETFQGEGRGPNFNEKTFDIENFVEVMFLTSYVRSVPKEASRKGKELARKLWDEKIANMGVKSASAK